jgi:hypothetical protein
MGIKGAEITPLNGLDKELFGDSNLGLDVVASVFIGAASSGAALVTQMTQGLEIR